MRNPGLGQAITVTASLPSPADVQQAIAQMQASADPNAPTWAGMMQSLENAYVNVSEQVGALIQQQQPPAPLPVPPPAPSLAPAAPVAAAKPSSADAVVGIALAALAIGGISYAVKNSRRAPVYA